MNNVTDEIKARLDIIDVINGYTPLRKAGRNFKAPCPFHSEKTPSFVVFPESQTWRCFGACGEGGDIFSFVMKKEGWDFAEALRNLADRAGVELEPATPQQAASKESEERLRGLLADAANFFHKQLLQYPNAAHARAYIEKRGLLPETIASFEIGYAPEGWDTTLNYLTSLGYLREEIVSAGLVVVKEDGGVYDRFRDRLVIPIRNSRGQIAGFGARGLSKDAVPKYLNSPQSELFDKGSLLFGLDIARRAIRETQVAVIVEGYMDVIQARQAGFTNVVAQMGTALTEMQLRLLGRYANRLILALDSDTAGQMATDRGREVIERVSKAAAEQATEEGVWDFDAAERDYRAKLTAEFDVRGMVRYESRLGFDIRVLILPEGQDPDDVIRQTPEAWPHLIEQSLPIIEYMIRSSIAGKNLDDPKVKSQIAKEISPLIEDVADPVERSHYRQRLARLLRVDERALFPEAPSNGQAAKTARPQPRPNQVERPSQAEPAHGDVFTVTPTALVESFCVASLIVFPRLLYQTNRVLGEWLDRNELVRVQPGLQDRSWPMLDAIQPFVVASDFAKPEYRMIFEAWRASLEQEDMEPLSYLSQILDPVLHHTVEEWLSKPLDALSRGVIAPRKQISDETFVTEAIQRLLGLRQIRIDEYIQELTYIMQDDANNGSSLTVSEYAVTIKALLAARHRLSQAQRTNTLGRKSTSVKQGNPQYRAS